MTWMWVNYQEILILKWTNPLSSEQEAELQLKFECKKVEFKKI